MYVMREKKKKVKKIAFKLTSTTQLILDTENISLLLNIIKLIQDIVYLIACSPLDFLYTIQLSVQHICYIQVTCNVQDFKGAWSQF